MSHKEGSETGKPVGPMRTHKIPQNSYQLRFHGLIIGAFGSVLIGFGTGNVLIGLGCLCIVIGIGAMASSLSHFY